MASFWETDDRTADEIEARRRESLDRWDRLGRGTDEIDPETGERGVTPTLDDLIPDYSYEDPNAVRGPERSELAGAEGSRFDIQNALRMLQEQASTQGLTNAERQMSESMRRRQEQAARGSREAALQQMEARGMGSSGLSLLSQMQASEDAGQRSADFDAQMAMAAQQRMLQALQGYGQLGANYYGQSFEQDATRRSAQDDFSRWQTDYARGVHGRNTERRNEAARARSDAYQQQYENRYRHERERAGLSQGYEGQRWDEQRRQQDRADRAQESAWNTGTGLLSSYGGG